MHDQAALPQVFTRALALALPRALALSLPRALALSLPRALALSLAASSALVGSRAAAEEPFDIDWQVDTQLTVAAMTVGGSLQLLKDELVRDRCAPHCDSARVNGLDQSTVGRYSSDAAKVGDVLVGFNLGLPHLLGALDTASSERSASGWGRDTLLLSETLAVSVALHQLVAFAARRPRPYAYNAGLDPSLLASANTYLSFYSGHTANSFAMATAYSSIFAARYPTSRFTWAVATLTHGLAALEGYSRVASGYHYPSDVLVGALAGSTVGLIVPWLHRRDVDPRRAWGVLPLASADSLGLAITWHEEVR
ncbi:MAG: phosphatase PAP2 family protein [Myxococcales bacterium]|nr:phosphatase PAP2 family protein [Myxococcales bacterium]